MVVCCECLSSVESRLSDCQLLVEDSALCILNVSIFSYMYQLQTKYQHEIFYQSYLMAKKVCTWLAEHDHDAATPGLEAVVTNGGMAAALVELFTRKQVGSPCAVRYQTHSSINICLYFMILYQLHRIQSGMLNLHNAHCHSVQNPLSSCLLSKGI